MASAAPQPEQIDASSTDADVRAVLDREIEARDIDALVRDFTDPDFVYSPFETVEQARRAVQECLDDGDSSYGAVVDALQQMTAFPDPDDDERAGPGWADPKHAIYAPRSVPQRQRFTLLRTRSRARRRGAGRPARRRGSRRGAARAAPSGLSDADEPPLGRLHTTSRAAA